MNDSTAKNYDVIIAGAGLVGASLAIAIAKACPLVRIAMVEASAASAEAVAADAPFDPRVVALTHASQQFLTDIGAWHAIFAQRLCAYRDMKVWDGEGNGSINFDSRDQRRDCLGHIVENSVALAALQQTLLSCANIEVLQGQRVQQFQRQPDTSAVTVQLVAEHTDTITYIQASLLVAADGANSKVREQAGFAMREWDYGHSAIVTTVRTQNSHQFTAWQRFMASGPLAFLPLSNDGASDKHCSIVWSCEADLAAELMALDDEAFCQRLGQAFEHRLGAVEQVDKRYAIPLRQRHAKTYIQNNIVLVGDAAHTIHPLAGQGVNLGLQDAQVLSEEIIRALARKVPLADISILRRYQRRRLSDNLLMMVAMEGFKRLFGSRDLTWRWLRNEGVRQVDSLPLLKKLLLKFALR